jgi:endogenous inhibitor of DNA gyrase (YacG/DUF329 family)
MTDKIPVDVTGGCPECGNPSVPVPEDYDDNTIIICPLCGFEVPWKDFFFPYLKSPQPSV